MEHTTEHSSLWSRVGSFAFIGIAFLVPLFAIPSDVVPMQFSKVFLALVLTLVALGAFFLDTLRHKKLTASLHPVVISFYALAFAYGIGTLFSSDIRGSLIGYQFSTDTFAFMLLGAVLAHTAALLFSDRVKIFSILIAFLMGSWVVYGFQIVQFLFNGPLPIALFSDPSSNLIGKWNDLALYAGFVASLTLLARESLLLSRIHRLLLSITLGVSLFFLAVINMREAWILFGGAAFSVLVLALVRRFFSTDSSSSHPQAQGITAFIVVVITVLFFLGGSLVAPGLQQLFSISVVEIRPSLESTTDLLRSVYKDNPVMGSGPNTFAASWLLYRSPEIAQTEFWNISFPSGSSMIVSALATGGILVLVAWAMVVITLLLSIVRALFSVEAHNRQSFFITSISAFGTLYLLFAHLVYNPSQGLTILLFLFGGLFVASLSHTSLLKSTDIDLGHAPRSLFTFVLGGMIVLLVGIVAIYGVGRVYASTIIHNQALQVAQTGDMDRALSLIARATSLDPQDRYFRSAAFLYIERVDALIRSNENNEATQQAFQNAVAGAVQNTGFALAQHPVRFENLMARGLVYAQVVPLGVEGALENGVAVYEEARKVNPSDPEIDWRLAQMYVARDNADAALESITDALSKKADYTPAILLRAQIALDEGDLDEAITSVKNAVYFEPNNEILLYQLGILLLQDESYEDASVAFELSLQNRPDFANATFFLAQAYAFLGRFDEAGVLVDRLSQENPEQEELKNYTAQLREGINPFAVAPTAPEVEETTSGEAVE